MNEILTYVKPELLVVAIVLYFVGMGLKASDTFKDKYIPLLLGASGIFICSLYVFGTTTAKTMQEILIAVFTAITQGILMAGLSTYVNQLIKQMGKDE